VARWEGWDFWDLWDVWDACVEWEFREPLTAIQGENTVVMRGARLL
jgi:hypothetical protein